MKLLTLVNRLLGRHSERAGVTRDDVRELIRDRQARQEARLRALDLQAELHMPRRTKP